MNYAVSITTACEFYTIPFLKENFAMRLATWIVM